MSEQIQVRTTHRTEEVKDDPPANTRGEHTRNTQVDAAVTDQDTRDASHELAEEVSEAAQTTLGHIALALAGWRGYPAPAAA